MIRLSILILVFTFNVYSYVPIFYIGMEKEKAYKLLKEYNIDYEEGKEIAKVGYTKRIKEKFDCISFFNINEYGIYKYGLIFHSNEIFFIDKIEYPLYMDKRKLEELLSIKYHIGLEYNGKGFKIWTIFLNGQYIKFYINIRSQLIKKVEFKNILEE